MYTPDDLGQAFDQPSVHHHRIENQRATRCTYWRCIHPFVSDDVVDPLQFLGIKFLLVFLGNHESILFVLRFRRYGRTIEDIRGRTA